MRTKEALVHPPTNNLASMSMSSLQPQATRCAPPSFYLERLEVPLFPEVVMLFVAIAET